MNTKHSIPTFLAAAMLTAMTACQNSPVLIETELKDITLVQPDSTCPIQFATFANRSTRAVATINDLEFYHPTFKVYGTKTSNEGTKVQSIFEGVTITANIAEGEEPNTWQYDTDRYWDKQADYYQFVAFAPAHAPIAYQHNLVEVNDETASFFSPEDYTLIGQNLMQGAPAAAEKNAGFTGETDQDGNAITDCDVMRSAPFAVTEPKTTPVVTLNFSHTLAKLMVTIKANAAARRNALGGQANAFLQNQFIDAHLTGQGQGVVLRNGQSTHNGSTNDFHIGSIYIIGIKSNITDDRAVV
jgi:hypothetical protein